MIIYIHIYTVNSPPNALCSGMTAGCFLGASEDSDPPSTGMLCNMARGFIRLN